MNYFSWNIFPQPDDTVSLADRNIWMIIIIKAIIGFEISFGTEFFQIPQFDLDCGWEWDHPGQKSRDHDQDHQCSNVKMLYSVTYYMEIRRIGQLQWYPYIAPDHMSYFHAIISWRKPTIISKEFIIKLTPGINL